MTGQNNNPYFDLWSIYNCLRATGISNSRVVFSHNKCSNNKCRVAGITNTLANDRELGEIQVGITS